MEELQGAAARLDALQATTPLLAALRTVSLGAWHTAATALAAAETYRQELERVVGMMPTSGHPREISPSASKRIALWVIGSRRGLCGGLNDRVARRGIELVAAADAQAVSVDVSVWGSRAGRAWLRMGGPEARTRSAGSAMLPQPEEAAALAKEAGEAVDSGVYAGVEAVFHRPESGGRAALAHIRVAGAGGTSPDPFGAGAAEADPPGDHWGADLVLVETDTDELHLALDRLRRLALVQVVLVAAAAAEHAERFSRLDRAVQTAEDTSEELAALLRALAQEHVTQESAGLATASGLVRSRRVVSRDRQSPP